MKKIMKYWYLLVLMIILMLIIPNKVTAATGNVIPKNDIYSIVVIIFCLFCVIQADKLWTRYRKDDQIVETEEFYPPQGYNSAEIDLLYRGESSTKGVISLLIYLANKGYLKIEETEKKGLFKNKKSFKIIKLKEYDGDNVCEKIFFNGLFKCSKDDDSIYVTEKDLHNEFYKTIDKIEKKLNSQKEKIFYPNKITRSKSILIFFMTLVIYILTFAKPYCDYLTNLVLLPCLLAGFIVLLGIIYEVLPIPSI